MNKLFFVLFSSLAFALAGFYFSALAHGNEATGEIESGKIVFEKLQAKQVECSALKDNDFHNIGEYFMERMTGSNHESMNQMMKQMMGAEAEEQMHIVMGKRMSSCDLNAVYPQGMTGFMPMMMGTGMGIRGFGGGIMGPGMMSFSGFSGGWFWFSAIFMILIWVLILALLVLGVMALAKYIKEKK